MSEQQYEAALEILKRLDPSKISKNLISLISMEPNLSDDLLNDVDQPLVTKSPVKEKDFLCCDYNRDGDNYRSPWTNKYYSPLDEEVDVAEDTYFPTGELRKSEQEFNDAFEIYKDMYYEQGSTSSCYLWETEDSLEDGFAGCVLFKKSLSGNNNGNWDSIHVFEIFQNENFTENKSYDYRITSTIILNLKQTLQNTNSDIGGNLQRQTEKTVSLETSEYGFNSKHLDVFHLTNLGTMVEEIETKLRTMLEVVYFDKSMNIYRNLVKDYSQNDSGKTKKYQQNAEEIISKGIQQSL